MDAPMDAPMGTPMGAQAAGIKSATQFDFTRLRQGVSSLSPLESNNAPYSAFDIVGLATAMNCQFQ